MVVSSGDGQMGRLIKLLAGWDSDAPGTFRRCLEHFRSVWKGDSAWDAAPSCFHEDWNERGEQQDRHDDVEGADRRSRGKQRPQRAAEQSPGGAAQHPKEQIEADLDHDIPWE